MDYAALLHDVNYLAGMYGDPPDPGTGDGKDHPHVMTCRDCDWRVSDTPAKVLQASIQHVKETAHTVLFRKVPQDLSRFLAAEKLAQEFAAAKDDPRR